MSFICKNIPSMAAAVLIVGLVAIPSLSRADTNGVSVAADSGAAGVLAFATKATFSSGATSSIAGSIVEKTNVPPGVVPVPATLGLLVLGIAGAVGSSAGSSLRVRKKK